jgi:hypothetical protein
MLGARLESMGPTGFLGITVVIPDLRRERNAVLREVRIRDAARYRGVVALRS